jgi:hypothetical protein
MLQLNVKKYAISIDLQFQNRDHLEISDFEDPARFFFEIAIPDPLSSFSVGL